MLSHGVTRQRRSLSPVYNAVTSPTLYKAEEEIHPWKKLESNWKVGVWPKNLEFLVEARSFIKGHSLLSTNVAISKSLYGYYGLAVNKNILTFMLKLNVCVF